MYGLLPTPEDARDFPLEKVFGSASPAAIAQEYVVSQPLGIKNQGDTDMCAAYALTAVSEDQEGRLLDPWYSFGAIKRITGKPDDWGADLRSACKSAVDGFLPVGMSGFQITRVATELDRRRAVERPVIKIERDTARQYAKKTYFSVTGSRDVFDNMRSAMWQTRDEERSIFTGMDWNPAWNTLKGGVIESIAHGGESYGHAVKFFGWDGEYMLAQLSNGKEIGEGGIFKLSREVVNQFCTYGAYTLMDLPRENVEYELGRIGWLRYWTKSIFA